MGDSAADAIYLLLCLVLVGSALVGMRLPLGKALKMALAWVGIFALGFTLFAFSDEWAVLGSRLKAAAVGTSPQAIVTEGGELRIPMRDDGHFWVEAEVNGVKVPFLVDSGASLTTIGANVAERAQVEPEIRIAQVETANGTVTMRRARLGSLAVGSIQRDSFPVLVAEQEGLNVLGMNFLSSLQSWRAEGQTLVLQP
jgi:aspartyl protease family protein